ncbi:ABC transporter ATP-binding protein [Roseateles amylovorans]|uniref:ABC transporter ATP-binding protein n=1 Tax=Roseateles amylovorans TaxID=2978473 RepID=UPI003F4934CA
MTGPMTPSTTSPDAASHDHDHDPAAQSATSPAGSPERPHPPVMSTPALIEVQGLGQRYAGRSVLRDVSFRLQPGESLGVIGESGAGKSTLARLVMGLERPSAGEVRWSGLAVQALSAKERRALRAQVQMVFQDPYGSLDPRWRVGRSVMEPLDALSMGEAQRQQRLAEVLAAVGMEIDAAMRFPHQFSGGQRQRLAIARALTTKPRLIVADEPLSALDVSVQAQILSLLRDLQQREGISLVLVSHDLAAVEVLCDQALVLRDGAVLEQGATAQVLGEPQHPYTRSLLAALA